MRLGQYFQLVLVIVNDVMLTLQSVTQASVILDITWRWQVAAQVSSN